MQSGPGWQEYKEAFPIIKGNVETNPLECELEEVSVSFKCGFQQYGPVFYLSGSELVLKIRKVDASVSTELNCLDDSFFKGSSKHDLSQR